MQLDGGSAQGKLKPSARIPLELREHLVPGLIVVAQLQREVHSV